MNFCSDNVTGISPEILAALADVNQGAAMPYGEDEGTKRLQTKFAELFETDVTVFPVTTGTAANALALSVMVPPFGAIYCHTSAHINVDECGAPEFYTGGAKLLTIPGNNGKLYDQDLTKAIALSGIGVVHHVQPTAISITQATEAGTVYSKSEVRQIAEVARTFNLSLHMDGARFANAVAHLGCSPADITWRCGVDVLCFGATKNGAMAAEAVIFFNPDLAQTFSYRRKRSGHLLSKMRFLSAQLEAYIDNDLWLKNAAHANKMAEKLATGLSKLPEVKLYYPVDANEIFVQLPEAVIAGLIADGFKFYRWEGEDSLVVRLVTAFDTKEESVEALIKAADFYSVAVSGKI
ncbi:threonine aldolase family protein [Chlorogloea sp. CCALA 695]|uniref:threonine aldolase family protein n=1 Tax=Chlorogloea sp. CCALA 695 TaxID=2107693 RepID=UPI000D055DEE|nr:low specificity L-threonine aldolase [Chlorogloea sp. CCALA 695]PSB32005.1 low specificity L-threonine aldolase [Chlorogloea sp. CCALA 695]